MIDPPAAAGSAAVAVASEKSTRAVFGHDLLATWLEPDDDGWRLCFSRYRAGAWSQPITIARQVRWEQPTDHPSLTVLDTQGVRRTLIARAGDIVARSGDAGRTWSRLPTTGLPFAAFSGGDEGGYVFWLRPDREGGAQLLGTRVLAGEEVLDPAVAEGAATAAAMTWDGPVVVYRDGRGRDLSIVRRQEGRWTRPLLFHSETGWRGSRPAPGGPAMAAERRRLAVAWFTETPYRPRLLLAFSDDAGRSFAPPLEVDVKLGERAPLDAFDVILETAGESGTSPPAVVAWRRSESPHAAELRLARVDSEGRRAEPLVLARGLSQKVGAGPRLARVGEGLAVAWIEGEGGARELRVALAPLAAVPEAGNSLLPANANKAAGDLPSLPGQVGSRVPARLLESLEGASQSLTARRGEVVVLNFWATWCKPCLAEMPELVALEERYGERGVRVVAVTIDERRRLDAVRQFVADRKLPFAIWLDPEMDLYRDLRVASLPTTFVVDRTGRILQRLERTLEAEDTELIEAVGRALDSP